jgi:hypothetical protein
MSSDKKNPLKKPKTSKKSLILNLERDKNQRALIVSQMIFYAKYAACSLRKKKRQEF